MRLETPSEKGLRFQLRSTTQSGSDPHLVTLFSSQPAETELPAAHRDLCNKAKVVAFEVLGLKVIHGDTSLAPSCQFMFSISFPKLQRRKTADCFLAFWFTVVRGEFKGLNNSAKNTGIW